MNNKHLYDIVKMSRWTKICIEARVVLYKLC